MTWVKEQNARTAKALESDPRFVGLKDDALKVYESPDHLAIPVLKAGTIYNTWQDAQHVRGILRRTTLTGYLSPRPALANRPRLRRARQTRQAGVGRQRLELPLPRQRPLPGIALCRRRRRRNPARIQPQDRQVRRPRLCVAALQTRRQLAQPGRSPRRPRLGSRHHDEIRLSLCREAMETWPAARSGKRNFSRHREQHRCPARNPERQSGSPCHLNRM